MLSKVLKGEGLEITPVPWRSPAQAQPAAAEKSRRAEAAAESAELAPAGLAPAELAELAELRARLPAMEAAAEAKAQQQYAAGKRAGEEAARLSLEAEVRETVQKLAATIVELAETRTNSVHRAEADMVRLTIEIARRVLHRELSVDSSALEALIKAALEKLQSQEVYRVRVHPEQEQMVRSCLDQTGRGKAIAVVADPVQPKGGALFEISRGSLDASVETQLAEIENGLIDLLESRAS